MYILWSPGEKKSNLTPLAIYVSQYLGFSSIPVDFSICPAAFHCHFGATQCSY